MIDICVVLEDCAFYAKREQKEDEPGVWVGTSTDTFTNTCHQFRMSDEQMGAIMFIALSNLDDSSPMVKEAYRVAETQLHDWPRTCRPIP